MGLHVSWKLTGSILIFSCLLHCLYAQVPCQDGDIRLLGGRNLTEGRVEICFNNQWGTVCDDYWDAADATVVCTQLGLPSEGAIAVRFARFGRGTGSIYLDNVFCMGNETRLTHCLNQGIGSHNCLHSEDAGVVCSGPCSEHDVRLRGGQSHSEGRVEICFNNRWGRVCSGSWSNSDGNVICRQLGFSPNGAVVHSSATFGPGIGPIFLDDVHCSGTESRLVNCFSRRVSYYYCFSFEEAGVTCQTCANGDIRLSGGGDDTEGGVEICYNATWGTVCDNMWGPINADVTCRQLGFSSTGTTIFSFGQGTGAIWLDNVVCTGNETRLYDCQNTGIGVHNCSHIEDAGVRCQPLCQDGDVRLRDGQNSTEGRVEICFNNQWGTVCDDLWSTHDGNVVCRQLGFSPNGAIVHFHAAFGQGSGPILLDDVHCSGTESRLVNCISNRVNYHDCSHFEDAGVTCQICANGDIRLRGGGDDTEGRVEICYNATWGTVCDNMWGPINADVACRQLGFSSTGATAISFDLFGQGTGTIWLDNVVCTGNEARLYDCQNTGIGVHNCSHIEAAGVRCQIKSFCQDDDIRLRDGRSSAEGRVEICFNNQWGTVCGGSWDAADAAVVCTQLGFPSEEATALSWAAFGQGDRPIHIDKVACTGNESRLAECQHLGNVSHDCTHYQDAGVICQVPVKRCNGSRNSTVQITEEIHHFGGLCQAYQGESILCDDNIGENISVYINRHVRQSELTIKLNRFIRVVFGTTSNRCKNLIRRVLCLYYYPTCGINGILAPPNSICPEECFYVQNECTNAWNYLALLESDLGFINCNSPEQILDPLPHCCVDAGITMDTSSSIPVPTTISTAAPTPTAIATAAPTPTVIATAAPIPSSPVAAGVTVALLLMFIAFVAVVVGLLWIKRQQRKKKVPDENLTLAILSRTGRNECTVDVDHEPAKEATCKAELTIPSHHYPDPKLRDRKLTPVMSTQMRQLTGKMLIPSSRIRLLDTLGHGEFGIVYKAHLLPQMQLDSRSSRCPLPQTVAVKTLKGYFGGEEIDNIMSESIKMKRFNHPNVIGLIGVCVDAGPAPYIIMPFMGNGSLLSYLKKHRTELMPPGTTDEEMVSDTTKRLISMCLQVAKGMEYLAEQKFVHRDLAARNCMIDLHDVIKVSDFGLTEDIYARNYYRQGREDGVVKLPVKWMSPESLNDGVFTEKTDVWSFGVTCWEIFSGGKNPYPGADLLTLVQLLENGRRLDKPVNAACSDTMYEIMLKCWQTDPDERPPFSTLVMLVSTDLEHQAGYLDFSFPTDAFSPQDSKEKCLALPSPTPPSPTLPSHTPPSHTPPSPPLIVVTQTDSDIN